mmetsp:Transcript_8177/g.17519  ORF Transcript_8177/g.17519 Transcript_8177/m.17519 type:complete len:524 (-) Transcript_8177:303-1874(-)
MATETMANTNPTWPTPNESLSLPTPQLNNSSNSSTNDDVEVVLLPPNTTATTVTPSECNPEQWEMIADDVVEEITSSKSTKQFVFMSKSGPSTTAPPRSVKNKNMGRPRSATVGHEADKGNASNKGGSKGNSSTLTKSNSSLSDVPTVNRRTLRRCASTPDLGNDRDVIVEEESIDSEENDDDEGFGSYDEGSDDAESVVDDDDDEDCKSEEDFDDDEEERVENDESFEVLNDNADDCRNQVEDDDDDEPVMVDEEDDEEEGTMISTPSIDTSGWTIASPSIESNTASVIKTSVWGGASAPSFKDILAKNTEGEGHHHHHHSHKVDWGSREKVQAMLHDSHRKHRLRVRTKPKLIVIEDANATGGCAGRGPGGKILKHAHSTGDLTMMLEDAEEERYRNFGQKGRRMRQIDAVLEEDEDADLVIGNGGGKGASCGGGGDCEILGDTDAMDYYHRKEKGSVSTTNKKKERPDEAKRKAISMHKKELQRTKQQEKAKNGGGNEGGGKKKKKNDKVFGGKKERRRL